MRFLNGFRIWLAVHLLVTLGGAWADENFVRIVSEAGDPLGGGISQTFTPATHELRVPKGRPDLTSIVVLSKDSQATIFQITLSSADYYRYLKPGTYNWPTDTAGAPPTAWIDVYTPSDGTYAYTRTFSLTIQRLERDETGQVIALRASFVLRLRDSPGTFSAEINYEDLGAVPANQVPLVHAGGTIGRYDISQPFTLEGKASDDDFPGTGHLKTEWSVVSGPGDVTFADASNPKSEVSFSLPGKYRLRLGASDGDKSATSEVAFTVYDPSENTVHYYSVSPDQPVYDVTLAKAVPNTEDIIAEPTADHGIRAVLGGYLWLEFAPAPGEELRIGQYSCSLTGAGAQIRALEWAKPRRFSGWFEIKELALGPEGRVDRVRLTYAVYNDDGSVKRTGDLRVRSLEPLPATLPLMAFAGTSRAQSQQDTTILGGGALDDSLNSTRFTAKWSKVSGPGAVTFTYGNTFRARATFSAPGTYVLRLTVSNGSDTATSDVTITNENRDSYLAVRGQMKASWPFTDASDRSWHVTSYSDSIAPSPLSATLTDNRRTLTFQGGRWQIVLQAPEGETLAPKAYPTALPLDSAEPSLPAISVNGEFSSAARLPGSFSIQELQTDDSGAVTAFRATFVQPVGDPWPDVLRGEMCWRATALPVPDNVPPAINAPSVAQAVAGVPVTIPSLVTDDGRPFGKPLRIQWSYISGPADLEKVEVQNDGSARVTFPATGDYHLQCIASDGSGQVSAKEIFVKASAAQSGTYNGLVTRQGRAIGTIKIQVTSTGAFTMTLRAGAYAITKKGKLYQLGLSTAPIRAPDGSYLYLNTVFSQDLSSVTGQFGGSNFWYNYTAMRSAADSLTTPSSSVPHAGNWTFSLEKEQSVPMFGHGYGALTVTPQGQVRARGQLPDGTPFVRAGVLGADGSFPLYVPVSNGRGTAAGQLQLSNDLGVTGTVAWRKPARSGAYYPQGINTTLDVHGSRYLPPQAGENVFTLENAPVQLVASFGFRSGSFPVEQTVSLSADHSGSALSGEAMSFKVDPATGIFTGKFREALNHRPRVLKGAILQGEKRGVGLFLHSPYSGTVELSLP